MSEVLSPIEIEMKMKACIDRLDDVASDLKAKARAAGEANHTYRQAQAKAWLNAMTDPNLKTDKLREAKVVSLTSDEMWGRDMAEADYEGVKALFRSLQAQSELLRSLARSSRDLVDSWHGGS